MVAAQVQCLSSHWKEWVSQHPLLRGSHIGFNPPSRYQTQLWTLYDGEGSVYGRQDPLTEGDFFKAANMSTLRYEHLQALSKS